MISTNKLKVWQRASIENFCAAKLSRTLKTFENCRQLFFSRSHSLVHCCSVPVSFCRKKTCVTVHKISPVLSFEPFLIVLSPLRGSACNDKRLT